MQLIYKIIIIIYYGKNITDEKFNDVNDNAFLLC